MGEAERRFTPAEANAELADLRERLPRLRDARQALIRRASDHRGRGRGRGRVAGSDWFEAQGIVKAEVIHPRSAGSCSAIPRRGWWISERDRRSSGVLVLATR
jgi:hypothetical protein